VESVELLDECAKLSENGLHPLDVVQVQPTCLGTPRCHGIAPDEHTPACPLFVPTPGGRVNQDDTIPAPPADETPAIGNSTWTHTVVDNTAKARIEAQHAALAAAGITVDTRQQAFATGTRMADEGYSTQEGRKAEHERAQPARDACAALVAMVNAEKRSDRTVSARNFADAITVNGKVSVFGHALSVQAIRGLMARIESPALGYVLGVQERCSTRVAAAKAGRANVDAVKAANHEDIAKLGEVLRHECLQASGESFKLRLREAGRGGRPDCYAIVGEGYADADANRALPQIVDQLPADARATFAYDVASTTWEMRLAVWTPTPVAQQAVGEAFEGYVSLQSRDNGTSRFRGGGGAVFLRCLNASTYVADDSSVAPGASRAHPLRCVQNAPRRNARDRRVDLRVGRQPGKRGRNASRARRQASAYP
jgi:hypothetical protein